jgi:hypothetical protein
MRCLSEHRLSIQFVNDVIDAIAGCIAAGDDLVVNHHSSRRRLVAKFLAAGGGGSGAANQIYAEKRRFVPNSLLAVFETFGQARPDGANTQTLARSNKTWLRWSGSNTSACQGPQLRQASIAAPGSPNPTPPQPGAVMLGGFAPRGRNY